MVSVSLYFQVHQPFRLRKFSVFDIGKDVKMMNNIDVRKGYAETKENKRRNLPYFDDDKNKEIMSRVSKKCYLPANNLLLDLISKTDGRFKVAFSITKTAIDQMKEYSPKVLDSFVELSKTGNVEFLAETSHHSLAYLFSEKEFKDQVRSHGKMIKELFHQTPEVFRNTELIYDNGLGKLIGDMGYKGILAEGAEKILGYRSPNFIYSDIGNNIKLLLKNYKLSDDVAFRFSNRGWTEHPLTAEKYSSWLDSINGNGDVVNLFMDYETLGEHQWASTGIFKFFKRWPELFLDKPERNNVKNSFMNPGESIKSYLSRDSLNFSDPVSWADIERDLSAWKGNPMQDNALKEIYALEKDVKKTGDSQLIETWRKLQTSDHFYYMCTKYFADGDVHKYFNPYDSPYDCFITFMNVLNDFIIQLSRRSKRGNKEIAKTFSGSDKS